ncbi:exodeoxyribonuclease I [Pseudomonas psychrotolerans]|uniref:exodeoxyribonuclease I n=1 Tax=Pseudomonas oryzihabitans TaxID=47885 RepID=UPI0015E3F593|nr:exodeoxyribonuclease I [Pseudomonas psychrotolerans]MBA1181675.1 exodeoxyribonuclease I [Pseudomonas psychrotolerans]
MTQSIFWYDFETTGIDPRRDRPLQVAGVRTDLDLNEIEAPLNLHCQLSEDVLPHPAACLVTGILPATLQRLGLRERDFVLRLHEELRRPNTCSVGYNNLRFDDEMVRHSLYRNFHDPYAREWQQGNSRWDVLGLVRALYAFRPESLDWPQDEQRVSLRLDRLTVANGIEHAQAHDALADVRATLALARLVKQRQPRLYDYLWTQRQKKAALARIRLLEPLLHVSGRFSAERHFLAPVLPLAWHPVNRTALIVCDLGLAPEPLLDLDVETLRERLYTRRDALAEGDLPVPLKLVQVNKCPILAPFSVLRPADTERLQFDLAAVWRRVRQLLDQRAAWQPKVQALYAETSGLAAQEQEAEARLYDGFIAAEERQLCDQVHQCPAEQLGSRAWPFRDERHPELFFRYRARNFPELLTAEEEARWRQFCRQRLLGEEQQGHMTCTQFLTLTEQLRREVPVDQVPVLEAWSAHVRAVMQRLDRAVA